MDGWLDPRIALAKEFPGYDISELDHIVEGEGLKSEYSPVRMRALFETPSGFAIFGIDSGYLYEVGSDYTGIETIWVNCVDKESADLFIWLRCFLKFDDKSTAIGPTGIDERLAELIEELCNRGEKLIVGESAYKEAIEDQLGITCICDEAAEELMWGMQNLLHVLVPEEKSEFSKQDRKFHSKKLLAYLRDHVPGRDIKPEMINGEIAFFASFVRRCDVTAKELSESLHSVDNLLEERSGLKTDGWDTETHATAIMKLIGESVVVPDKMFTDDERNKIAEGVGKYDNIIKANIQKIYRKAIRLNQVKVANRDALLICVDEAKSALEGARKFEEVFGELPQVVSPKGSCEEEETGGGGQRKKLKVNAGDDENGPE